MFQVSQKVSSGYKLLDKGNGFWQMVTPQGFFTGSLKQVVVYSVNELGFSVKELEIGVTEMEKHFHNAAEYGILKAFMWSYDQEEKNPGYSTKH